MPINPAIPLSVQPPAPIDPMRIGLQAAQLREAQQMSQLRGLQIDETKRQYDTQAQIRDAMRQAGSLRAAMPQIKQIDPLLGNDLEAKFADYDAKVREDARKMDAEDRKTAQENAATVGEQLRRHQLFSAHEPDPASRVADYRTTYAAIGANKAFSTLVPSPDDYAQDPDHWDAVLGNYADHFETFDQQVKRLDAESKQTKSTADAAEAPFDLAKKAMDFVGTVAPSVTDQASLDGLRKQLVDMKVPSSVISSLPTKYSPAAMQRFMQGALTEKDRADMAFKEREAAAREEHDIQQEQAANPFGNLMGDAPARRRYFGGGGAPRPAGPAPAAARPSAPAQGGAPTIPAGQSAAPPDPSGPHGEAFLQKIPPAVAAQVKALAEGRQPFPGGMSYSRLQPLIQAVSQYDPSFDATNYQQRANTRKEFTTGATGKQINALNTAIGHMESLSDAAVALDNHDWRKFNSALNWVGGEFGTDRGKALVKYQIAQKAVADETTRVWRGTGGTEADIQSKLSNLSEDASPNIQHAAIGEIADLLASKIDALDRQFQTAMGSAANIQMLSPESQKLLAKFRQRAGAPPEGVPPDVQMALQGKVAGRYTGKDGSVWIKNSDGSIVAGK